MLDSKKNNGEMTRFCIMKGIRINRGILGDMQCAIGAAIAYQGKTGRKLGITAELGEVFACYILGLRLVCDNIQKGYDAIDKGGKMVQIKTRRSETEERPKLTGRLGSFSKHDYDYALFVMLSDKYKVTEIWKVSHKILEPIVKRNKRRNPTIRAFIKNAKLIYPKVR